MSATTREVVDALADELHGELLGWDACRPWRMLFVLESETTVSAYALNRARDLARLRPEIGGKTAIVTANPMTTQIVSLAMRALPNVCRRRLVFGDEAEAIVWLLRDDKINLNY